MVVAKCSTPSQKINLDTTPQRSVTQLRWDKADLGAFYHYTGLQLNPLLPMLDDALSCYNNSISNHSDTAALIDTVYCEVVDTLVSCANNFVSVRRKSFYKFWWDEELQILKEASIDADKLWKSIGKPSRGPIFDRRQSTRLQYRKRLRYSQTASAEIYTSDLHEALMRNNGPTF